MRKKAPDYLSYFGIAITVIGFISSCGIALYKLSALEKSMDELKKPVDETKMFTIKQQASNEYFIDALAELKLSVRALEQRRR